MDIFCDSMLGSRNALVEPAQFAGEAVIDLPASNFTLAPLFRPIFLPSLYIVRILLIRYLELDLILVVWILWASA